MNFPTNDFDRALARVHAGDRQVQAQLSQDLTPHMARLLRHALAQGAQASPLGKRLLQTAQHLDPGASPTALAGRLARMVLDRLHPDPTATLDLGSTQAVCTGA